MNRAASVIDTDRVVCVAQRRCEDLGITVRFSSSTSTAYTNGRDIVLPVLHQPITKEQLDTLYGYVIHETGHHLRSDAFAILKSANPPEHICALYNIIEDDGMERERALAWKGDRKALSIMNNILVSQVVEKFTDLDKDQPIEQIAVMMLYQLSRLDWDEESDVTIGQLLKALPKNIITLLDELLEETWIDRMRKGSSPHDTWDIAIDLAKRLYPDHPEEELEEIKQAGHSKSSVPRDDEDDTISDEGTTSNEEGDEEEGEGTNAKGEGEEEVEADGTSGEGYVISWKDAVLSEHNEWESKEDGQAGCVGIDWTGMTKGARVGLMPLNEINVIDLSKNTGNPIGWTSYLPHNEESRAFANRIRRYIQAEARSRVDKEKYHGTIDKSAIVRLALPPIDKGEYNKKIFYDQRKHTLKDTAIFVLTDWSGSMQGRKMVLAADASQRLVHVFERVLKVPVALACFSDARSDCDIGYIKPYNTRGLPPDAIAKRFAKFTRWCCANNDADSVHWAWRQILKRKEQRKILIVLSDGCPAGSWKGTNDYENLKYINKTIEQDKRVELYGVGICSDAVKTYYTNHKVLRDAEEINQALFNIIREGDNSRGRR